jgi:hypothetical protein
VLIDFGPGMDKTIRKYTDFDEMKADEYRYWQSRPVHERVAAVSELTQEGYAMKGEAPDVPRFQRTLAHFERMIMRFRPANISLINRRPYLPRLLLSLSSKVKQQRQTTNRCLLTGSLHVNVLCHSPFREARKGLVPSSTLTCLLPSVFCVLDRNTISGIYGRSRKPRRRHRRECEMQR